MIKNGLSPMSRADLDVESIFHPVFNGFAGDRLGKIGGG
jgi:hypothetical protein